MYINTVKLYTMKQIKFTKKQSTGTFLLFAILFIFPSVRAGLNTEFYLVDVIFSWLLITTFSYGLLRIIVFIINYYFLSDDSTD